MVEHNVDIQTGNDNKVRFDVPTVLFAVGRGPVTFPALWERF